MTGPEPVEDGAGVFEDGTGVFEDGAEVVDDGTGVFDDGEEVVEDGEEVVEEGAGVFEDGTAAFADGAEVLDDDAELVDADAEVVEAAFAAGVRAALAGSVVTSAAPAEVGGETTAPDDVSMLDARASTACGAVGVASVFCAGLADFAGGSARPFASSMAPDPASARSTRSTNTISPIGRVGGATIEEPPGGVTTAARRRSSDSESGVGAREIEAGSELGRWFGTGVGRRAGSAGGRDPIGGIDELGGAIDVGPCAFGAKAVGAFGAKDVGPCAFAGGIDATACWGGIEVGPAFVGGIEAGPECAPGGTDAGAGW